MEVDFRGYASDDHVHRMQAASEELTQRQLSARTGIPQSEISRIEGGRANPTTATLAALARALGGAGPRASRAARRPSA